MKRNKCIWLSCMMVILSALFFTLTAQNKQEKKKEKIDAIKELIESGHYKIEVSRAYPQKGNSVYLTSPYSLEIRNDSVISQLPFYGRAYSIPYGGGDGLMFKAPLDEYDVKYNAKKKNYQIKLKATTREDTFQFTVDIYSNGSSRINANMRNRGPISYSGELDSLSL